MHEWHECKFKALTELNTLLIVTRLFFGNIVVASIALQTTYNIQTFQVDRGVLWNQTPDKCVSVSSTELLKPTAYI